EPPPCCTPLRRSPRTAAPSSADGTTPGTSAPPESPAETSGAPPLPRGRRRSAFRRLHPLRPPGAAPGSALAGSCHRPPPRRASLRPPASPSASPPLPPAAAPGPIRTRPLPLYGPEPDTALNTNHRLRNATGNTRFTRFSGRIVPPRRLDRKSGRRVHNLHTFPGRHSTESPNVKTLSHSPDFWLKSPRRDEPRHTVPLPPRSAERRVGKG